MYGTENIWNIKGFREEMGVNKAVSGQRAPLPIPIDVKEASWTGTSASY